jgi:hypothetical protein
MTESAAPTIHSPEEVRRHVRGYLIIGVALLFDLALAVSAYYAHAAGAKVTLRLILCLAALKLTVVVFYFKHLISSKRIVYGVLALTVLFFLGLMLLSLAAFHDHPVLPGH